MPSKKQINLACVMIAPFFILISGYFLFTGAYLYSLLTLIGIVVCMETRVRLGYRGARQSLFAIHLACSTALIIALIALSNQILTVWALPLAYISFLGMTLTGVLLIRQSWHPVY